MKLAIETQHTRTHIPAKKNLSVQEGGNKEGDKEGNKDTTRNMTDPSRLATDEEKEDLIRTVSDEDERRRRRGTGCVSFLLLSTKGPSLEYVRYKIEKKAEEEEKEEKEEQKEQKDGRSRYWGKETWTSVIASCRLRRDECVSTLRLIDEMKDDSHQDECRNKKEVEGDGEKDEEVDEKKDEEQKDEEQKDEERKDEERKDEEQKEEVNEKEREDGKEESQAPLPEETKQEEDDKTEGRQGDEEREGTTPASSILFPVLPPPPPSSSVSREESKRWADEEPYKIIDPPSHSLTSLTSLASLASLSSSASASLPLNRHQKGREEVGPFSSAPSVTTDFRRRSDQGGGKAIVGYTQRDLKDWYDRELSTLVQGKESMSEPVFKRKKSELRASYWGKVERLNKGSKREDQR